MIIYLTMNLKNACTTAKYMKWFYKPVQKLFAPSEVTKQQLEKQGFHNVAIWSRG